MENFSQILLCILGTFAFAITMNAPKKSLMLIIIGSAITAATENIIASRYNEFTACLTAMLELFIFCEISAKLTKQPTTVILMPSTIPLLPGSSIYYTMLYAIQNNRELMIYNAKNTLFAGLGIALGAVIGSAVLTLIRRNE
ncbi:MAG: threonine/serine exporter family protein [Eubacterium sp.]|nr:threonine/serine exporter family protein [Eubacterium sp.]